MLVTAHRLPAPIQEIPESPTPKPEQSAKPKPEQGASAITQQQTMQLPSGGFNTKSYSATGLIERLEPDLILFQKGHETWMAQRAADTQINGAPKAGDVATVIYWLVATKDDHKTATYQISGSILEIDNTRVVVRKGDTRWEIATDNDKVRGRIGDNVDVTYRLIAKSITRVEERRER
jgi:hypothetical protein